MKLITKATIDKAALQIRASISLLQQEASTLSLSFIEVKTLAHEDAVCNLILYSNSSFLQLLAVTSFALISAATVDSVKQQADPPSYNLCTSAAGL